MMPRTGKAKAPGNSAVGQICGTAGGGDVLPIAGTNPLKTARGDQNTSLYSPNLGEDLDLKLLSFNLLFLEFMLLFV